MDLNLETPDEKDEQIKNLESQLHQAEEKIKEYKLQVENLNAQTEQLKSDLNSAKQEADNIAKDRNALRNAAEMLDKQVEVLLNQNEKLTDELRNQGIDVSKYKTELNNMKNQLKQQNNELDVMYSDNEELKAQKVRLLNKNNDQKNQIDDLKGQVLAIKIGNQYQGETQAIEMDKLKKKNDELKNQIAALQEELKKKNDELKNQIAALQNGKNSDSLIDKIILDKEYKRTRLIIGISLAVVGLSLIISPFIIPSIFGMGGVTFGSVFLVSALFSVPALFYGNQNLNEEELYKIELDRKTIVKDDASFKKVSGLVLGIGLILAGLLCLAFPHLALFYFLPQVITNALYLVFAVFGAYLTSRFYAIKQPEFKPPYGRDPIDYNVYPSEYQNKINNPNLMQNNFGYNIPNNLYNDNKGQNRNYYMNPNGIDDQNLRNNDLNYNNAQNQFNDYKNDNDELPNAEEVYRNQDNNQNIDNNYGPFGQY